MKSSIMEKRAKQICPAIIQDGPVKRHVLVVKDIITPQPMTPFQRVAIAHLGDFEQWKYVKDKKYDFHLGKFYFKV